MSNPCPYKLIHRWVCVKRALTMCLLWFWTNLFTNLTLFQWFHGMSGRISTLRVAAKKYENMTDFLWFFDEFSTFCLFRSIPRPYKLIHRRVCVKRALTMRLLWFLINYVPNITFFQCFYGKSGQISTHRVAGKIWNISDFCDFLTNFRLTAFLGPSPVHTSSYIVEYV